jgi:WD40 repeat protein
VSWSPDGTRIASGSLDKTVRVWDVSTETELIGV